MKPTWTRTSRLFQGVGIAAVGFVLTPAWAIAHGAHIQSRATSAVEIQAAYDTGEPMAAAQVQVFAPDDPQSPVFTGTTDEAGHFVFVPNQPGNWEISVRQAGHGDIAVIPVEANGAIAPEFINSTSLSPLQRIIISAAVAWGCVGTALYFRRGKR
ncbi:carboxypeptidase-like regulatory domain-containing protein [Oscillatoria sp. CS-180]|uniref:carboxypeptidase-like regulatory domain-containing protein n=1 Tax=Oscillatoria sp. CS-180 TaxID=3021720 RepID=UPI00232ABFE6|nr:carboxypeptidase-like regulatory domain-containing protein [Oscillatoria sp. CS-180]MDB9525510.1 carboxypeptidase-like regulatory domain-containing protein [Oscillatoria sp. CS-180]